MFAVSQIPKIQCQKTQAQFSGKFSVTNARTHARTHGHERLTKGHLLRADQKFGKHTKISITQA